MGGQKSISILKASVSKSSKKPLIMTIMSGYNDTAIPTPGDKLHYQKLYEDLWDMSLSFQPNIILITSWNEWHENTQIKPSHQRKDYLREKNDQRFNY